MTVKSSAALIGASAGLLVFGSLVIWFALRLIRSNREQLIASGPLIPEQQFTIAEPGEVLLLLEVSRLTSGYDKLKFAVTDVATGTTTAMQYQYARAQGAVRGMSTVKIPMGQVTVVQPGPYLVRVTGLDSSSQLAGSRILLSRPYLGRMIGQILGIVLCAVVALLCLVFGGLQLRGE